ncbi:MAG: DUF455 family protein, partial [Rhodoferax sp.]
MAQHPELRQAALTALCLPDPKRKVAETQGLYSHSATYSIAEKFSPEIKASPLASPLPGRPAQPALIHPAQVPRRSPATLAGRAALVHAICHIEFNAINLALDAVWRFD